MQSSAAQRISWIIFAVVVLGTLIAYPSLPSVMATHFGVNGQVNGTSNSFVGAFILPVIMLLILLLFTAIPRIDPLRVNIAQFRRQYDTFVALLMLFFAVIQAMIIARNLGSMIDPGLVILPAVGKQLRFMSASFCHRRSATGLSASARRGRFRPIMCGKRRMSLVERFLRSLASSSRSVYSLRDTRYGSSSCHS